MGVGIPAHLLSGHALSFVRPSSGGLSAWSSPKSDNPPYWTGTGYVSVSLASRIAADDGATQKGMVLFYLDPVSMGGEEPEASDLLLIDGVLTEVVSVRRPNAFFDFWKVEVRTGAA